MTFLGEAGDVLAEQVVHPRIVPGVSRQASFKTTNPEKGDTRLVGVAPVKVNGQF